MKTKFIKSIQLKMCKWFGHSFDRIDLMVADIKLGALNSANLNHHITCRRCKETFNKK